MKKIFLFSLLFTFMLTGCFNTTPEVRYIKVVKTDYKHLPKDYYRDDIKLPKPKSVKEVKNMKYESYLKYLTKLNVELYKTIAKYKLKLKKIEKYEEKINR